MCDRDFGGAILARCRRRQPIGDQPVDEAPGGAAGGKRIERHAPPDSRALGAVGGGDEPAQHVGKRPPDISRQRRQACLGAFGERAFDPAERFVGRDREHAFRRTLFEELAQKIFEERQKLRLAGDVAQDPIGKRRLAGFFVREARKERRRFDHPPQRVSTRGHKRQLGPFGGEMHKCPAPEKLRIEIPPQRRHDPHRAARCEGFENRRELIARLVGKPGVGEDFLELIDEEDQPHAAPFRRLGLQSREEGELHRHGRIAAQAVDEVSELSALCQFRHRVKKDPPNPERRIAAERRRREAYMEPLAHRFVDLVSDHIRKDPRRGERRFARAAAAPHQEKRRPAFRSCGQAQPRLRDLILAPEKHLGMLTLETLQPEKGGPALVDLPGGAADVGTGQAVQHFLEMDAQALAEGLRAVVSVVGTQIRAGLAVVKLFLDKTLNELLLPQPFFLLGRARAPQCLFKRRLILPGIGDDVRSRAILGRAGLEHEIELTLGAGAVGAAIGTLEIGPQRRAEPRPKHEHGDIHTPIARQEQIDPFLKASLEPERHVFPKHRHEIEVPGIATPQSLDDLPGALPFFGHVAGGRNEDPQRLHDRES